MDKSLSKPMKCAVFYVIRNKEDEKKFVAVKRPEDDEDLPGVWGLPAGSVKEDESFEEACINRAKEKLKVDVKILKFIGRGNIDRGGYILHGEEFLVEIVSGELDVSRCEKGTKYADWKWALPEELKEASSKGSLCSSIYLESCGVGSGMKFGG